MKLKRMHPYEFKTYIESQAITAIHFSAEAQTDYDPAASVQFNLHFSKMLIVENPDTLYLFCGESPVMTLPHIEEFVFLNKHRQGSRVPVQVNSHSYTGCQQTPVTLFLEIAGQ